MTEILFLKHVFNRLIITFLNTLFFVFFMRIKILFTAKTVLRRQNICLLRGGDCMFAP